MNEMMTFPDTWEEFEKLYGFNDAEEIYTNNSRLIPSFRVKQWLDHLLSVQQEQLDCEDCIKNGGDWECDRVHCHKGDVPDTNVGELISRQEAIKAILGEPPEVNYPIYYAEKIRGLPSVQPRRGKWHGKGDSEGFGIFICDNCGKFAMMEFDFCPNCGSHNGGDSDD